MKKWMKTVSIVSCTALLAGAVAGLSACVFDMPSERDCWSVTVANYDDNCGKVEVSEPEETYYSDGELVTVTVTAYELYEVASFRVNETEKALNDAGQYSFRIYNHTRINVEFERAKIRVGDSEELTEALESAGEGDHVHLSEGEFTLPAGTKIAEGVTISGNGEDTVLVVGDEEKTNSNGLHITSDNVTISNITIEAKNIGQSNNANYSGIIRLSGNNVTLDGVTVKSKISTSPVVIASTNKEAGADNVITIKNCHIEAYDRALFIVDGTQGTINVEGCYLKGLYPININTGSTIEGLNVSNSTLVGWTSFGASTKQATFTNCTFADGNSYNVLASYTTTTLTNCTFESNFKFQVQKEGITINVAGAVLKTGDATFAELLARINGSKEYTLNEQA